MTKSLTKFAARLVLVLTLASGFGNGISAQQNLLEKEKTSPHDAEVMVTIAVPEGIALSGTAIVTIEDISMQDTSAIPLARKMIAASTLMLDQSTIAVPINLSKVNSKADVNVAVHIDTDDNGVLSDGDWVSDSIVSVINNAKMAVIVDIVPIGVQ